MEELKIVSGGKLLRTRWIYDEDKDLGSYVTEDVTDYAPYFLFDACTIDDGVVLKDIFLLLKSHIDIFKTVIGRDVEVFVKEGLQPFTGEETELHYLELYWVLDYNEEEKTLSGNNLPNFHGVGEPNDINKNTYSLMYSPANVLADIPLKLCQDFIISHTSTTEDHKLYTFKGPEFSLGQILYGIIWEISYCGPPEVRDREFRELEQDEN